MIRSLTTSGETTLREIIQHDITRLGERWEERGDSGREEFQKAFDTVGT